MVLRRHRADEWDGTERRQPASVLIVNDDRGACELLVRFLALAGFRTAGACSEIEAVAAVYDELPRCVVLDMTTGGVGSSLSVLDQIRSHDDRRINSARVVLCASSPKNRSFSFESGADAFLVRPFHLEDLIAHVKDVIERPQEERVRHRRNQVVGDES